MGLMGHLKKHKRKDYLPIGTVVLLNNGEKRIMIYGRRQIDASGREYDYVACLYPEGNIGDDFTYLFDEKDIREVVYRGYSDKEEESFQEILNEKQPWFLSEANMPERGQ